MLKRYLSFALALIMCLSALTGVTVLAADDDGMDNYKIVDVYVPNEKETGYGEIRFAEEGDNYPDLEKADARIISALSALGMADAFGKMGKFDLENAITRGEFIALTASLINADRYPDNSKIWFTDVLLDNDYFKEISVMAALGVISGYSDGTFRPDNTISYNEAVAVVMKALGYQVAAEVNGGYSLGYGIMAGQAGLTDGITVKDAINLSRIEAARIIYNAFNCPLNRATGYGDFVYYEADKNCTALTEYHEIYKVKGRVNATFVSSLTGYSTTNSGRILIEKDSYIADKDGYVEYLGYYVEVYYTETDNNDKEILYLVPDKKVEEKVIKADDVENFSNLTYYYENGRKARIAQKHSLIVNGVRLKNYTNADFIPENGDVILLSYDGALYDTVIINTYHSFLLKSLTTDRDEFVVFEQQYSLPSFKIDFNNKNQVFVMYMDDRKIDFYADKQDIYNADGFLLHQILIPEIPADTVFNIFADKYDTVLGKKVPAQDAKFIKIVISTGKIEGKTDSYNEEEINIDDGENIHQLMISEENLLDNNKVSYKFDISGFFLLDYDGRIFAFTTSDGGDQYVMGDDGKKILVGDSNLDIGLVYGYLIKTALSKQFDKFRLEAKLLATDGSINIYTFADKVMFNGTLITDHKKIDGYLQKSAKALDPSFTISQLIKYELNKSGEIKKIETISTDDVPKNIEKTALTLARAKGKMASRSEFGWVLWAGDGYKYPLFNGEARQYFKVPNTETFEDADYTVPVSWWPNNTTKTVEVFDCDEYLIPSVVVQYDDPNGLYEYEFVMVKEISQEIDENGNFVDVLHFVGLAGDPLLDNPYTFEERSRKPGEEEDTDGGEARFFATKEGQFNGLVPGDVIEIYGSGRRIVDWNPIMKLEDVKNFNLSDYPKYLGKDPDGTPAKRDIYEVYSVIEGDKPILMVQRGKPTDEYGKREYMQLNPFEGDHGVILYDASGREPKITYWNNPHVLDQARLLGTGNASRVFIYERSVAMKLLVGYIGLD